MQGLSINEHILIISLLVNLSLFTFVLLKYYPKIVQYYKQEKIKRERQKKYFIRKVVREYLEELQK